MANLAARERARRCYLHDKSRPSLREVAEKLGISVHTVRGWSRHDADGQWKRQRDKALRTTHTRRTEKAIEKTAEHDADDIVRLNATHHEAFEAVREQVRALVRRLPKSRLTAEALSRTLQKLCSSLKTIQEGQRLARGLTTAEHGQHHRGAVGLAALSDDDIGELVAEIDRLAKPSR